MRGRRPRFPGWSSGGAGAPPPLRGRELADGDADRGLGADRRRVLVVLEDREEAMLARLDAGERDVERLRAAHAEHGAHAHHPPRGRVDVRVPVPVALDRSLAVEGAGEAEVLDGDGEVETAVDG